MLFLLGPERSERGFARTFLCLLLLVAIAACPSTREILTPRLPFEGALGTGEAREYEIACAENQFIDIAIDQRGVDVTSTLRDPEGRTIAEMDGHLGASGTERLLAIVPSSGTCTLETRAISGSPRDGIYTVRIDAQRIADESDRRKVEAAQLYWDGIKLDSEGEYTQAIDAFKDALERWTDLGDVEWRSLVHYSLGQLYANKVSVDGNPETAPAWVLMFPHGEQGIRQYEPKDAILHLVEAVKLSAGIPGVRARAYQLLGEIHLDLYQLDEAREYYEKALPLWRDLGDRLGEATDLNNLGFVYKDLGELQNALRLYDDAIRLWRETGISVEEMNTISNRGKCYAALNRTELALADFESALEIWKKSRVRDSLVASTFAALGGLYADMGRFEDAHEQLNRSLEFRKSNPLLQAITRVSIATVYLEQGDLQKANEIYQEVLPVFRELGYKRGEAVVLFKLGETREKEHPEAALEFHDQAVRLSREIGDRDLEAAALFGSARAESARGELDRARSRMENALDRVDQLRKKASGLFMRSVYFAGKQDYYDFYIDLLMRISKQRPGEQYERLALAASERSRARTLLELLADSGVDLRPASTGLFDKEKRLLRQIEAENLKRERMLTTGPYEASNLGASANRIRELLLKLDEVRGEIRVQTPLYAELTQPRPLNTDQIQKGLLDADTLLLEYHLGEPHSYLFAVSAQQLRVFALSGRGELEAQVQLLHDIVTESPERMTLNRGRLSVALADLSDAILRPAAEVLRTKKRLLIVAEGALQSVPFSALPSPSREDWEQSSRLVDSHEIVFAPSATILNRLRQRFSGRQQAPRDIAVVADPVFLDDPRLEPPETRAGKTRQSEAGRGRGLGRLVYSGLEAKLILEQVNGGDSMSAIGFDATKSAALSKELRQYRILHLATHGILDTEFPELSSLVFSRVDRRGNEIDGFVHIFEVYGLDLNAEMVVLSACRTAKGRDIRGEGLVGWTHGFMYSGAKRVLVSLWDVDDEATAQLMGFFYFNMFKAGLSPAAALQQAQSTIRRQPRWRAPYFWAGFVLQGEYL